MDLEPCHSRSIGIPNRIAADRDLLSDSLASAKLFGATRASCRRLLNSIRSKESPHSLRNFNAARRDTASISAVWFDLSQDSGHRIASWLPVRLTIEGVRVSCSTLRVPPRKNRCRISHCFFTHSANSAGVILPARPAPCGRSGCCILPLAPPKRGLVEVLNAGHGGFVRAKQVMKGLG